MPVQDPEQQPKLLPLTMPGVSDLAICTAAFEGNLPLLRLAVDKALKAGDGPGSVVNSVDSAGRSPLHWACSAKQVAIVKYLLDECDADVQLLDEALWTPLMIASSVGSAELVDLLIVALGVNGLPLVNAQNQTGQTALHYAASKNHIDCARALLETNHANVNAADNFGSTPVHRAASRGHLQIVKLLLANTANGGPVDSTAIDSLGNTALHLACEENYAEIAVTLVQFGFNLEKKNADEKTPLQLTTDAIRRHLEQIHSSMSG